VWLYQKLVKTCTNWIGNFSRFVLFSIYSVEALRERFTQTSFSLSADGLSCLSLGAPLRWLEPYASDSVCALR
jgi:hypothetical protein